MPVRNSYRPRRRFSRCDHQPQVKSTPPPSFLLLLPLGRPIPVPFSFPLRQPHLPYPRSCTAMRQSLIKFNNFCAACALPILWRRPLSLPSPSPAFLDLLFSSSTSHSCYSISHCPAVYLRSTAVSPLSTSPLWSLRHVINLHLSQWNHWVPQIYDGDMPDLLKRPRSARDSIFNDTLARLFTFSLFYFRRRFVNFVDNVDRIFTTNVTFPKLLVDMLIFSPNNNLFVTLPISVAILLSNY